MIRRLVVISLRHAGAATDHPFHDDDFYSINGRTVANLTVTQGDRGMCRGIKMRLSYHLPAFTGNAK